MKKNLLTLLSALFISTISLAQFKVLATGNGFEEPRDGYAKIIQEKNGYTFFVHLSIKDGMNIRIYDENHQPIADKNLALICGKLKIGHGIGIIEGLQGVFEINNNIAVFISEYDDNEKPILYRIIIDGKTGDLLEEKIINSLKDVEYNAEYAPRYGRIPIPKFDIRKDPESDNYAVASYKSNASGESQSVELVYYNKNHQEISKSNYQAFENNYKYLNFMDFWVQGDKEVVFVAVGMNSNIDDKNRRGTLLMGSLKSGAASINIKQLDYPDAGEIEEAMIRYNKIKDEYILLSVKLGKRNYESYKTIIKPNGVAETIKINSNALNNIANTKHNQSDQFVVVPQLLRINSEGGYTIIFEEYKSNANMFSSFSRPTTGVGESSKTIISLYGLLEDVAAVDYNADGKEMKVYYIPKSHRITNIPRAIYYSFRDESGIRLVDGMQYRSFYFLNGKNKRYILMNDLAENQDLVNKGKDITPIIFLKDCEAFSFEIGNDVSKPKRKLVFENTNRKKEKEMAVFSISDFDKENNVFVTLKLEHIKGDKEVKLVWLQPE